MGKLHAITQPTRRKDISWDEVYDEISDDWQAKAERLQVRRWRKLKRQLV